MSEYREACALKERERREGLGLPEPFLTAEPWEAFKAPLQVVALGGDIYAPTQLCGFLSTGHRVFIKHQAFRGGGVHISVHDWDSDWPDTFYYFADTEDPHWYCTTWEELRPLLETLGVMLPETLDHSLLDDLYWSGH